MLEIKSGIDMQLKHMTKNFWLFFNKHVFALIKKLSTAEVDDFFARAT